MRFLARAALFALLATPAHADGLIDNVAGYTLTAKGGVARFTGMLIDGGGRVAKLLAKGDKRPDKLDFRLDAKGRALIPGLIDTHGHVMALGFAALRLDLSGAHSLAEAQAKLKAYADANPGLRWIIGGGWSQDDWGLGRFPTAAEIDAVVPDRPVWLERIDGHAGWANGAALVVAKIDARTTAPAGGRIETTGGRPTGVFVDAAMDLIGRFAPAPLPRERDAALARAQDTLLALGVTATADMGTTAEDWNSLRRMGDAGRLKLRVIAYAAGIEPMIAIAGGGPTPWLYDGRLRMIGVNLSADGALGSRGAWLKADYADAPGQRGLRLLDDAKLRNLMSRAAMDGFQIAVEATGDAAVEQTLSAIEEEAETYTGDRRWRIAGAQAVDPADLPRLARNGIIASMPPADSAAQTRLGPGRTANAWRSTLDAGAKLAFGSGYPAASPDPFAGLAAATGREDAQRLTIEQALAAYTSDAALAGFAEDRLGTLEPGHTADFLLLDRDIFKAAPADLRATKVQETWIGGVRAWVRK